MRNVLNEATANVASRACSAILNSAPRCLRASPEGGDGGPAFFYSTHTQWHGELAWSGKPCVLLLSAGTALHTFGAAAVVASRRSKSWLIAARVPIFSPAQRPTGEQPPRLGRDCGPTAGMIMVDYPGTSSTLSWPARHLHVSLWTNCEKAATAALCS